MPDAVERTSLPQGVSKPSLLDLLTITNVNPVAIFAGLMVLVAALLAFRQYKTAADAQDIHAAAAFDLRVFVEDQVKAQEPFSLYEEHYTSFLLHSSFFDCCVVQDFTFDFVVSMGPRDTTSMVLLRHPTCTPIP